jgi:anti-sigma factor RsiW
MTPEIDREQEWARERIEAYLDVALAGEELARFEKALEASPELREEVSQAQALFEEIHALPVRECPDGVVEKVLQRTLEGDRRKPESVTSRLWIWGGSGLGFALGMALFLFVSLNPGLFKGPAKAKTPVYTKAEVAEAEAQIGRALEYLARVGARTGAAVGDEVVQASLVQPARQTARAIVDTKIVSQILPNEKEES